MAVNRQRLSLQAALQFIRHHTLQNKMNLLRQQIPRLFRMNQFIIDQTTILAEVYLFIINMDRYQSLLLMIQKHQ